MHEKVGQYQLMISAQFHSQICLSLVMCLLLCPCQIFPIPALSEKKSLFSHSSIQFNHFFLTVYFHLLAHSLVALISPQQPCSFISYASSPTKDCEGKQAHYRLRRLPLLSLTVMFKKIHTKESRNLTSLYHEGGSRVKS